MDSKKDKQPDSPEKAGWADETAMSGDLDFNDLEISFDKKWR